MNSRKRKYPVGIQSFEKIRKEGYVYVDKTALIYKMISEGFPYFLSRPRRFGKSLLIDTLEALFMGRRDLFEAFTTEDGIEQPALFIAGTNWKWEKYPVLRFNFNDGDMSDIHNLDKFIDDTLTTYEQLYGISQDQEDHNLRLRKIIRTAYEQTGKGVVVLVDEYDNFILNNLGDSKKTEEGRQRFSNLFAPLKAADKYLRFIFVTGISKFSQMGIFSKINQLNNISMQPSYETLCGISEEELKSQMQYDIEQMALRNGKSFVQQFEELKTMYDGYHFGPKMTDVYNPFSLMSALSSDDGLLHAYWFASGTPAALVNMLSKMPPVEIKDIDGVRRPSSVFDQPLESYEDVLPLIYQSGYITIKNFNPDRNMYTLGFPNKEVREGFADCLFRYVASARTNDEDRNVFLEAYYDFRDNDQLTAFIEAIQTFFAGFSFQLDNTKFNERHFHSILYTLLIAFGADVTAEETSAKGASDIVLKMPKTIYIMELKHNGNAEEALQQIHHRGYAEKYRLDDRRIVLVGINFSDELCNISDWKCEEF